MTEVDRIAGEFGQAVKGDPWHGPSLTAALEGVTAEIAASRPHATVHTIWEITLHLAAWEGAVTRRLKSGIAELPPEGDWPALLDSSENGWHQTLALLEQRHQELQDAIQSFPNDRMDQLVGEQRDPPTGGGVTYYATLHGVVQHAAYHAGQIAIIRKWLD